MGDTPWIALILRCKQIQETKKKEKKNKKMMYPVSALYRMCAAG